MIAYLANQTRFREELHGKGVQASCLFPADEQAPDAKATGRMPMLLSNPFVAEVEARTTAMNHLEPILSFSA